MVPKHTIKCVGSRKEPSKEAVDRFIEVYNEMLEENEKREKEKTPSSV